MNTHIHKPDWYKMGVRFDHLIHDPRFWVAVVVAVLLGVMVLMALWGLPDSGRPISPHTFPVYPYVP